MPGFNSKWTVSFQMFHLDLEKAEEPKIKLPNSAESSTHSIVLAWRIPGTAESGGLPSMGLHRVGHNWSYLAAAAAAVGSLKKQESSRKISTALLTMPKPLTVWAITNCGKFLKRWEYQTTWPASWEIYMQVRKQQLELNMEQQIGSK